MIPKRTETNKESLEIKPRLRESGRKEGEEKKMRDVVYVIPSKASSGSKGKSKAIEVDDGDDEDDDGDGDDDGDDEEEWTEMKGSERCVACVRDGTVCQVNLGAFEKWREEYRTGVRYNRHPSGMNCTECTLARRKQCQLPATEEMRGEVPRMTRGRAKAKGGSEASSTTLGGKRKGLEMEVIMPPRKRLREATGMSQEEFWGSVV